MNSFGLIEIFFTVVNAYEEEFHELVVSDRILVFAQIFVGSPRGENSKFLEGNIWRKVVSTSKKIDFERDQRFLAAVLS